MKILIEKIANPLLLPMKNRLWLALLLAIFSSHLAAVTANFGGLGINDTGGTGFKSLTDANIVVSNKFTQDGTTLYFNDSTTTTTETFVFKTDGVDAATVDVSAFTVFAFNVNGITIDSSSSIVFKDTGGSALQTMTLNANKAMAQNDDRDIFSLFDNNTTSPVTGVAEIEFNIRINSCCANGNNFSNLVFKDITYSNVIAPVSNNAPNVDLNGGTAGEDNTASFSEGGGAVNIAPSATVTDADADTITTITVTLTNDQDGASEGLNVTGAAQNALTGISGATDITLQDTISIVGATASVAEVQTFLQNITYNHSSSTPNTTGRTVTVVINDGTDNSTSRTSTVSVSDVTAASTSGSGFNTTNGTNLTPGIIFSNGDETLTIGNASHTTGTANGGNGTDVLVTIDTWDMSSVTVSNFETLNIPASSSATMSGAQHNAFTTFIDNASQTIVIGSGGVSDSVTGESVIESYTLGSGFTGIFTMGAAGQNVTGSDSASDIVQSGALTLTGTINGGAHVSDGLILNNGANIAGATVSNFEILQIDANGSVTMTEAQHDVFTPANVTAAGTEQVTISAATDGFNANATIETYVLGAANSITLGTDAGHLAQNVTGSSGNDNVTLGNGTYTGTINAAGGTGDTLSLVNGSVVTGATLSNFENLTLADGASVTITAAQLGQFSGTVTAIGTQTINVTGDGNFTTLSGIETFSVGDDSTNTRTISLAADTSSITANSATDAVTFNLGTVTYTGTLTGNGSDDIVQMGNGSSISGATLSSVSNLSVDSSASVTMTEAQHDSFSSITATGTNQISISAATDGFTADVSVETYVLGAANAVTLGTAGGSLSQNITGSNGNDTLLLGAATYTGSLNGSGGTGDTLSLANGSNIAGATISNIENLTLASGATARMTIGQLNNFSGTVTAPGSETIELTATGTISNTGLSAIEGFSTLSGGAETVTTTAAIANGKTLTAADTGTDGFIVTGSAGAQTINGSAGADNLSGGDGADTLSPGAGADSMTGGADADTFQGSASDLNGDTITDLSVNDRVLLTGVTGLTTANVRFNGPGTLEIDTDATDFASPEVTLSLSNNPGASLGFSSVGDSGGNTLIIISAETTPPSFDQGSSTPTDNAVGITVGDNVVLDFSENVQLVAGQTITINDVTNSATRETFTATNASTGTGSSGGTMSVSSDKITLNPGADLQAGTRYAVQITGTTVTDSVGNAFAGIADNTTFNFTTAPDVAITVSPSSINEVAAETATYRVSLQDGSGNPFTALEAIQVSMTAGGSATGGGTDYTVSGLGGSSDVTIGIGLTNASFSVQAVNDGAGDDGETVSYTLNSVLSGSATFSGTNVATVTIVENVSPTANADTGSTAEDTPVAIDVLGNDTDSDGTIDATTVNVASGPTNGSTSVNPTNGEITYTPTANFNGNDSFTYTVDDNAGGTSNAATVSITISPVNDPPTAVSDTKTIDEDSGITIIDVLDNDVDLDSTIDTGSLALATPASNGTALLNGTTIRYQPNANFSGTDSFTYTIKDNEGAVSDPGTVTITVTAVDDGPVARDDSASLPEGTSKDIPILDNDSDVDGTIDVATVEIVTQPASGAVVVSAAGVATYTPNAEFFGLDSFTYTVKNTDGVTTNVATVSLVIDSTNVPPQAADDSASVDEDSSVTIALLENDADSDGTLDTASLAITSQPGSGSVTVDAGQVTYTPTADFNGSDQFRYTIADNDGATSEFTTVSITVNPINDPPVPNNPVTTARLGEDYSFTYSATDVDGDTLMLSSKTLPSWLNFTVETGVLSGTPGTENLGDNSVILSVTDGTETIDTEFTLVVTDPNGISDNNAPVPNSPTTLTANVGEEYRFTYSATDEDAEDTLTLSASTLPSWLSFDAVTGVLSGIPAESDIGSHSVVLAVSDGTETVTTSFTLEVVDPPVNNAPTGDLLIIGNPEQNQTLTADTDSIADEDGLGDFNFTWQRNGTEVSEATGNSYLLTQADVDSVMTVSVSYVDGAGTTETLTSAATGTIANVNDAPTGSVLINGDPVENSTLTLSEVLNDPDGLGEILYQWQRNGASISGATADSYSLSNDDLGAIITVILSYTDQQGTNESISSSNSIGPISAAEPQTTPPTITPPDEVTVDATGLFTKVDLGPATAVDAEGNPLPVSLVDANTLFSPGKHIVFWQAEDSFGTTATAPQTVNVNPRINFSKDQTTSEGKTVSFRAILNGPAATYPVTVPYSVSGTANAADGDHNLGDGSVTIAEGKEVTLSFNVADDDISEGIETIVITMGSPTNAVAGAKRRIEISIVEENVAPYAALAVSQDGEKRLTVSQDGGSVLISAEVEDPNIDDLVSREWIAIGLTDTDSSEDTFSFDPASVATGIYQVSLFVFDDGLPILSSISDVFIEVTDTFEVLSATLDTDGDLIPDDQEGYADADGDGIPDFQDSISDCNVVPEQAATQDEFLVESEPGVCLRRGSVSAINVSGGLAVLPDDDPVSAAFSAATAGLKALPQQHATSFNQQTIGEYIFTSSIIDFRATLSTFGQSMDIVIPQRAQIPENAVYRKLIDGLWQDFIVDDNNGLASAPGEKGICPPPGDEAFTEGLNEGHWCVQLTIEDGGPNDGDGKVNRSVDDPGGVATLFVAPEPQLTLIPLSQTDYEFGSGEQTVLALAVVTQAEGAELRELVFAVSGEVDPAADIGHIGLYLDSNQDGLPEGEILLAAGVADTDTGQVLFRLDTPLALPAGETRLLVTYEF